MQQVVVYILIVLAGLGACRFCYRKLKALGKKSNVAPCSSCPLRESCDKAVKKV